jgi:hypothetical protein
MADRRRIAAALEYLGAMRDRAAEFGSGVAGTLANRARDVGGLAYEAFTSDPNIGRMNTAEFAQAAASRAPTPRLDAAGQGAVELGRAVLTQPVQTGKALVQGEVDRARQAMTSPRAAGEYAGSMVDPLRLASALRRGPMQELEGYQGSPHKFEPTPNNPLGELDSSKIGTGEGAQAFGHGIYIAESRKVGEGYRDALRPGKGDKDEDVIARLFDATKGDASEVAAELRKRANRADTPEGKNRLETMASRVEAGFNPKGYLYTLDLPDEMIDRMLDWDKPLDDWTANKLLSAVRKKGMKESDYEDALGVSSAYQGQPESGSSIYRLLAADLGGEVQASQFLKDMGIPGIRYLDAGSRGKDGTGTRNFVVFPGEEKKVKILRRE